MLRVRLTLEPDGATCLESPYDRAFVEGLKLEIPYEGRSWDSQRKRWIVSALFADALVHFLQERGCQILDDRQSGTAAPLALPPMPADLREAFDTLFLAYTAPLCVAEAAYKALARHWHPDHGGNAEDFHKANDAIHVVRHYLAEPAEVPDDDIPF